MPGSIPASALVTVNPNVIGAGGTALSLNGLMLTTNTRVPIGSVLSFPSQLAVAGFFGANSLEASEASVYFNGFDNSNVKPGALLLAQYPAAPVSAYMRGGAVGALTLTQLQAITGVLAVTIDGVLKTSSAINLSAATSFSNAAQLVNAALAAIGSAAASVTGSIASTTLTVTAVGSGALAVGQVLSGTGVTAGTYITALGTGAGGTGTYTVSASQTTASTTIASTNPAVSFDSVSGAFVVASGTTGAASTISFGSGTISASLALTSATGATLSQGAIAATPVAAMNAIIAQTQNFASFMTIFEPITADKVSFATWANGQNNRYAYVFFDTDITVTAANPTASAGAQIAAGNLSGSAAIYSPSDLFHAAFVLGAIASIDFSQLNGRTTLAYRGQTGLTPGVSNQTIAAQLIANGYNFYGVYATATQSFNLFQTGSISGPFKWIDSFIDQIWMNSGLQQAMLTLLQTAKSIPYNNEGYALIRQAAMDPINAALNFGAIRANVPLGALQAAEVNAAAGQAIDQTLATRGWHLQILPASAQVRAARGTPPMSLWYMDGQSVQTLNLASVLVQ